jgi:prepilin-type N-terminal cleavage/methylation domain-containing protein
MNHLKQKAFTLVELIVVITILAILWTIAFISFQLYATSARDSARVNDIKIIEKGLVLHKTKGNVYPTPDDALTLTSSWTAIIYQGNVWSWVLSVLWQAWEIVDPWLWEPYTYSLTTDRRNYQIMWYLEEQTLAQTKMDIFESIPSAYSNQDYSDFFFKSVWDNVWIILDESDNSPIQNQTFPWNTLDIFDIWSEEYKVYNWEETLEWWSEVLSTIIPNWSCKRILDLWKSEWDWVYTIKPSWDPEFEVYCDMTTDWWGWTLFYANNWAADSIIKQSYATMFNNVFNNNLSYDLKEYDDRLLAWLINFKDLADIWSKEVLIRNRNSPIEQWWRLTFDKPATLKWMLDSSIVGIGSHTCTDIPNWWYFSVFDNSWPYNHDNLTSVFAQVWLWISHWLAPCNWYTSNRAPHLMFYNSSNNWDVNRTRSNNLVWWTWWWDNQYRYFIR